jgi:gamma-glutamylcyclotransferase (GGCT)/AIG2-like uncharacterized protein YtfP
MALADQYIAFYGTLMEEQHTSIRKHLEGKLVFRGKCLIPGRIYNMGRYPSLKLDGDREMVHGELYKIVGPAPLDLLDDYEAHDNYDPSLPGFTRRLIQLKSPRQTAWVYEYDGPVKEEQLIPSENWHNDKAN